MSAARPGTRGSMGRVSLGKALLSEAEDDEAPGTTGSTRLRGLRLRPWAVTAVWVLGVIAAFASYLQLARTRAVNSDGAGQALQAWDMLHGNLLLHGWSLGDVSYYTTEVPAVHAGGVPARAERRTSVHVAAAMTYTLATLLAALLAKGNSTGRQALVRVLIAVGIMLAPQLASGVNILLSSPDHIGTSVPVMVAWLILDRARPRWYVPVIVGVLLGWAADRGHAGALHRGAAARAGVRDPRLPGRGLERQAAGVAAVRPGSRRCRPRGSGGGRAGAARHPRPWRVLHAGSQRAVRPGSARPWSTTWASPPKGCCSWAAPTSSASARRPVPFSRCCTWSACSWRHGERGWRHGASCGTATWSLSCSLPAWSSTVAVYVLSTRANVVTQTREIAAVLPFSAALAGRLLAGRLQRPS